MPVGSKTLISILVVKMIAETRSILFTICVRVREQEACGRSGGSLKTDVSATTCPPFIPAQPCFFFAIRIWKLSVGWASALIFCENKKASANFNLVILIRLTQLLYLYFWISFTLSLP